MSKAIALLNSIVANSQNEFAKDVNFSGSISVNKELNRNSLWNKTDQKQESTVYSKDSPFGSIRYWPRVSDTQRPENICTYAPFKVEAMPRPMLQCTFPGVADENYVYYLVEEGGVDADGQFENTISVGGIDYGVWTTIYGSHNWMQTSTSWILKISRKTGNVDLARHLGEITGIRSTNIKTYEGTGADQTRGPMVLNGDYLYTIITSTKYAGAIKIRKMDLAKVWMFNIDEDVTAASSKYHVQMRQISVMPADATHPHPIVMATASGGLAYGAMIYDTVEKLFEFFQNQGIIYGLEDKGATFEKKWEFASVAQPYQTGELLNANSFGQANDTVSYYVPLEEGHVFRALSATTPGTAGSQKLIHTTVLGQYPFTILASQSKFFTFADGHVFSAANDYTSDDGLVTVKGSAFLESGANKLKQPILKTVHRDHVGVYQIPNNQEAVALSHFGGGFYGNQLVDPVKRRLYAGSGNNYYRPFSEIKAVYDKWGLSPYVLDENGVSVPAFNGGGGRKLFHHYSKVANAETGDAEYLAEANEMWESIDAWGNVDDPSTDLGARSHRDLFDALISIDVDSGELKFAVRAFPGEDTEDHSLTAAGVFGIGVALGHFLPNGFNEDCTHGAHFFECPPIPGKLEADPGKETATVMMVGTKSRMTAYDLKRLEGTLTHVDGDASLDYRMGIKANRYQDAALFLQKDNLFFGGSTTFLGTVSTPSGLYCHRTHSSAFSNGELRFMNQNADGSFTGVISSKHNVPIEGNTRVPWPSNCNVVFAIDTKAAIEGNPYYKWTVLTAVSQYVDNGAISCVGDALLLGNGINSVDVFDITNGTLKHSIPMVGGSTASVMFLNDQIFAIPGNTKWANAATAKVYCDKIVMYTPYGA